MSPEDYQIVKKIIATVIQLPADQQQFKIDEFIKSYPHLIDEIKDIKKLHESTQNNQLETPVIISQTFSQSNEKDSAQSSIPKSINDYKVIEKLGAGGMGNVYLAKQEYPAERLVAIKVLKEINNQQQLIAETQILAQLNHPNIATLFEIDQTQDNCFFIVMEYIKGDDIVAWCDKHHYTIKQRIALFDQLCEGISFAHQKGIIHCDIKPSNLRVTEINNKPVVKIIDFGISQFEENQSKKNEISGTPAYLAPEVLNNKNNGISETSRDIYALGVLLAKLLPNELPFDLQAIVNKSKAYEKAERYLTPIHLSEDLNRYLNKQVVLARESNFWYVGARFVQRRYGIVLFAMALLLAIIGGYWAQAQQAKIATEQAQLALASQIKAQESEQKAQISLKESQELTQFLTDLFNLSNPEKKQNDTITANDLINKASDKLLAIEQPTLSDAGFMHTLSDIYTRMDKLDKAQLLSEIALKIKQSKIKENDPLFISQIIQLGLIHRKQGNSDESEKFLLKAINLLKSNQSIDKVQLAFVHNHLGNLYWQTQQKDKSIAQHHQAIELRKETGEFRLLADSYNNLAVIYKRFYEWDLANKHSNMALDIYLKEYGDRHPYIALMKHNISAYLIKQYKWQEAEKLLLEALSIFTEVYGESHNNTISSQYNLAQLYEKMLLFDKAINKWNIIIGIYKSKNNSEQVAKFHSLLALTLNQAGRHEEALEHNLLSIEISKDLVSNQINFNAQLLSRYARTLIASESLNEAKTILIQSLELLEKDNEKNNYERLFVLNILADVHFKLKNNIKAIETYKEILNHDDKENKLNQKEQIKALLGSGMVMLDSKQYFEAEQYFQDALTLNQTLADENYTESIILYQMGKLKKALDLTKEAQSLFNQAMNIQSKILPENHPDLILTKNMIDTINNY